MRAESFIVIESSSGIVLDYASNGNVVWTSSFAFPVGLDFGQLHIFDKHPTPVITLLVLLCSE